MTNNYLLESTDYLSIQNEIAEIIKKTNFSDSAISIYDIEETLLEKALEDLDTYSFLTSKKIIIIQNIESIDYELYEKDLKHLYQYLDNPNPDNLLIITSRKLNNTYKYTKELKKKCTFTQVSMDPLTLAKKELKDYKLAQGVLNLLMEYCKDDVTKLKNECLKLKAYRFDEKTISKEDVEEMCIEKLGDSTTLTFSFSRNLAAKDKKKALEDYRTLLNYNLEPHSVIGLLASQMRIMYQVKSLEEKSMRSKEIAQTLGEKEFRVQKTMELTRYYTFKEIRDLIIKLQEMDLSIKTSDVDPNALIELFILNI